MTELIAIIRTYNLFDLPSTTLYLCEKFNIHLFTQVKIKTTHTTK